MRAASLVVFCTLTTARCAHDHQVYSLYADPVVINKIASELKKDCAPGTCFVDRCWQEQYDLTFCNVEFSFVLESQQAEILKTTASRLQKKGTNVGFCGRDSPGTRFAGAIIGGLAAGVASAAVGGGSGSGYGATAAVHSDSSHALSDHLNERLADACSETTNLVVARQRFQPLEDSDND